MQNKNYILQLFSCMFLMLLLVGFFQSWNLALSIFNLCIISAIMSLGINIQWGNAGIVNFGVMGFAALGGLANVIISMPPTLNAWEEGGILILSGIVTFIISIFCSIYLWKKLNIDKKKKYVITSIIIATSYFLMRYIIDIPILTIESIEPAKTGYLGGFDLPVIISWPIGGLLAALTAYAIGKIALGLRSDYLAIATLGISEIIIYVLKNEDWLSRGVKNVNGLPRPVPYEIELQSKQWVIEIAQFTNVSLPEISSIIVKFSYSFLFIINFIGILSLLELSLEAPSGRMMRDIRYN